MDKLIAFTEKYIERPLLVVIALWLAFQFITLL